MKRNIRKGIKWALIVLAAFLLFCWANNTNLFIQTNGTYKLLAHRGVAQTFDLSGVEWDTNTAAIIDPPQHAYLENTILSMQAAFQYGAAIVELDIQKTLDLKLAVFHDYDLSMRTNGNGKVSAHTMGELKQLDIGYGYTSDGGKSYPLRGKGIGLMPELSEVLSAFAQKELLLHVKDGDPQTTDILLSHLNAMSPEQRERITIYGDHTSMCALRQADAALRVMSKEMLVDGLIEYELLGWSGYVPEKLHHMELHIPLQYAHFLWGWPNKFVDRMASVNTRVVLVAGDGKWSEGFDSLQDLKSIPSSYTGYVWTNRIEALGKAADVPPPTSINRK